MTVTGARKTMAVTPDNQSLPTSGKAQESASLDLPISMAERFMAQMRRVRWMIVAIGVVVCVLLVSGRIDVAEAAFTFGFLGLTAIVTGTVAAQRQPLAHAVKQPRRPKPPSYEQLIRAWPQPVILVDQRLIIRTINAPASDLMDIPKPGDPLSFRLREPDVLAAVQAALDEGRASTKTILEKVPSERMLQLHIRPFSYTGTSGLPDPSVGHEGRTARFVIIVIEDDTATYRSERMRSDFVANASHELRTPLASISGCIETLQGPAKNDPVGQERFLTIMSQQADRMTALIDDLLSLNRIEMRAHRTPTECVNLETTVREAIDLARPSAEAANVTIDVEPSTSPATVRGDASELRQIAINLLQNAIKYGASGERVDISLRDAVEGGVRMVELQVRDHGPGIAPEHLPRLTERFYRAHEDSNPVATGTGLGLAIVKHIIARHRGRLLVESTPGEGASFSVRLPYMAERHIESLQPLKDQKNQSVKLSQD
jgi:two-component system phosphate regulon sensor histidine kinase PhoR